MSLIDLVQYEGPPDQLIWKFPSNDLSTKTQVIVAEGQEAVFMREGKALDVLGPGRHTLSTGNIPILEKLINLPFGGKTPFTAEVFYVNKRTFPDVPWGTSSPIQIEDPRYKIFVSLRSFGTLGFKVAESQNFLNTIVGRTRTFDLSDIKGYFRSITNTRIKDIIAEAVIKQNISIAEITAFQEEVSTVGLGKMKDEFAKIGLELTDFLVNSINFPEDDPGIQQLKQIQLERARVEMLGQNYDKVRSFDTMEKAAENEGGAMGGMMQAGMGFGVGAMAGQMAQNTMGGTVGQGQQQGNQQQTQIACPKCGTPNPQGAKFCSNCGTKMEVAKVKCWKCQAEINEGTKFCPECGSPQGKIQCPECNSELQPGAKFCSNCGHKF